MILSYNWSWWITSIATTSIGYCWHCMLPNSNPGPVLTNAHLILCGLVPRLLRSGHDTMQCSMHAHRSSTHAQSAACWRVTMLTCHNWTQDLGLRLDQTYWEVGGNLLVSPILTASGCDSHISVLRQWTGSLKSPIFFVYLPFYQEYLFIPHRTRRSSSFRFLWYLLTCVIIKFICVKIYLNLTYHISSHT